MTTEFAEKDPILAEMVKRIVEALKPERIFLFGSRARGDAGPDSDYDLLIVVKEANIPRFKLARLAFRSLCGVGAAKDVVVLTRSEFDSKSRIEVSLPATVLREGNLLYAA
jgi:predicted nucleotidyltransferase